MTMTMIKEALILLPLIAAPALAASANDGVRTSLTLTSPAAPPGGAGRVQPGAGEFAWSNRPDISPNEAKELARLYRELANEAKETDRLYRQLHPSANTRVRHNEVSGSER
jgi:hypothetical protein